MRYYKILVSTSTSDVETSTITGYDSLDGAKKQYHNDLYQKINDSGTKKVLCVILNEDGSLNNSETWTRPTT